MFKQLISHFIRQNELREERKREEIRKKYYDIRGALIKYYEDLDRASDNTLDIPAFKRADKVMSEFIKNDDDINRLHAKLVQYKQVA